MKKTQKRNSKAVGSRRSINSAKLNNLPDDQVAQIVAWLFSGKTYADIRDLVKRDYGVTCSLMAVKTMRDKYSVAEEQFRTERIIQSARLIFQSKP